MRSDPGVTWSVRWTGALAATLVAACSSSSAPPSVSVRMSFERPFFFAAPFPSDDLRRADGSVDVTAFPNPDAVAIVAQATDLVAHDARGFSLAGGIFFSLTDAIDPARLPGTLAASVAPEATVFLVAVDRGAPDFGKRHPIEVHFEADPGPFGAPNMLSIVPLQGVPLRSATRYAAVVLRSAASPPLSGSPTMATLAGGGAPAGLQGRALDAYREAVAAVVAGGTSASDIAGLAAFTTDAPLASFEHVRDDLLAQHPPAPAAWKRTDLFDAYCVYTATLGVPDYQSGQPPFQSSGGAWAFDAGGRPLVQRVEPATLVVSVPRRAMPAAGYPTAVFVRAGGGGSRPMVDRGQQATDGGPPIVPGSGPALQFARAGFAGVELDGPLEGLRNTTNGDEDFLIFNVFNPPALRDNVRESAVELVFLAHLLDTLIVDATDCPGAGGGSLRFDTGRLALMGHSMGASIAPLVAAFEPRYRAIVLSGAGASWIENVIWKQKPLAIRPAIELLLRYTSDRRTLTNHDPALTMLQWAAEPADSQVYASRILTEPAPGERPRNVLMVQGIVDHYILPRIANAISLSLGLDLAGAELDNETPEIADETTLKEALPFAGRTTIALPARANIGPQTTAIVTQQRGDGIEDGHEVVFQTDPPKYEYKCFLASFAAGAPSVPDGAGKPADAPCP
jgi:hypothetical protein